MDTNKPLLNFIFAALFDKPVKQIPDQLDATVLFSSAKKNAVSYLVYQGLQKTGASLREPQRKLYQKEADIAMFTYLMQSQQIAALSELFEKEHIPFVLLKGSRIRELYPSPELRTSSDIDILTRADDETLLRLMREAGFCFNKDGGTTLNFSYGAAIEVELHRRLFDDRLSFHGYFDSIWERVQLKEGWKYRYVMSEEDFFVNMIAHFAKHFSRYGCGIRNAVDIAVYLKNAPQEFDLDCAEAILKDIGLYPFEQRLLQLIRAWETDIWTEEDTVLTDYILGCGLFGTRQTATVHSAVISKDRRTKGKMILSHIFPSFQSMSKLYPILKKCPIFLPFCWLARGFRLIFFDRNRIRMTLQDCSQVDGQAIEEASSIMQLMHLEDV